MSATASRLAGYLRNLLYHPLGDRNGGCGDYDQLLMIDSGPRGYDIVLRVDGGYSHPADADNARSHWQRKLDAVLSELDRENAA